MAGDIDTKKPPLVIEWVDESNQDTPFRVGAPSNIGWA